MKVLRVMLVLFAIWAVSPAEASRGTFNVADTVTCDGVTDRLSAIQAILDGASAGSTIVFPSADCFIAGTLSITKALVVTGQGSAASSITQDSATSTTLLITTTDPVEVRGLYIHHPSAASGGACIDVSPPSGVNVGSRFTDLVLSQCFHALRTTRAAHWNLTGTLIFAPTATGVWVQNDNNHDEGDSQISDSLFTLPPRRLRHHLGVERWSPHHQQQIPGRKHPHIRRARHGRADDRDPARDREFDGLVRGGWGVRLHCRISGSNRMNLASTITGNSFSLTCLMRCAGTQQYGVALLSGSQAIVTGNVFGGGSAAVAAIHVASTFDEAAIGENSYSHAFDVRISNASPTTRLKTNAALMWGAIQGSLGEPRAGAEVWCADCRGAADPSYQAGAICTAPGGGAVARRVGLAWRCW